MPTSAIAAIIERSNRAVTNLTEVDGFGERESGDRTLNGWEDDDQLKASAVIDGVQQAAHDDRADQSCDQCRENPGKWCDTAGPICPHDFPHAKYTQRLSLG